MDCRNICLLICFAVAIGTLSLLSCKSGHQVLPSDSQLSQPASQEDSGETPPNAAVNQGKWPKTVSEAVDIIIAGMSESDKETVRDTKKENLIKFHHGWGTGIRNEFGLWGGNNRLMADTGKSHPDDASMVIIEAVWEKLQK